MIAAFLDVPKSAIQLFTEQKFQNQRQRRNTKMMSPFTAELLSNLSTDCQPLLDIDRYRNKEHLTLA